MGAGRCRWRGSGEIKGRAAGGAWALALLAGGCGVGAWPTAGTVGAATPPRGLIPAEACSVARALPAEAYLGGGIRSAGPRFGLVHVTGEAAATLRDEKGASPDLTAWGWQWEYRYESSPGGPTGLIEFVPLLAGLEQGLKIPTVNVLFGLRTASSFEIAVGPNISPVTSPDEDGDGEREVSAGIGLTFAVGYNFRIGEMNLPVNIAYVSNEDGPRYSVTFGWNLRQ